MKIIRGIIVFILIFGALYLVGPRVETPRLNMEAVEVPSDLIILNNWIEEKENTLGNIRSDNASKIERHCIS